MFERIYLLSCQDINILRYFINPHVFHVGEIVEDILFRIETAEPGDDDATLAALHLLRVRLGIRLRWLDVRRKPRSR